MAAGQTDVRQKLSDLFIIFCIHFVVPMGIVPMGSACHFPLGKPAATESRYPTLSNYKVHAECLSVFIIHRTLTWTTGSLTCARDRSGACVYTFGHTFAEEM